MAKDTRIQQLIQAGVAQNTQFSDRARQVINSLSDDEFNLLLSTRSKVQSGDTEALQEYDRFLSLVI
jgi:hypothetical protein